MGVRADDRAWPDPADPERLALRRQLAAEHPDCIAELPGHGVAAVADLCRLVDSRDLTGAAVAQGDDLCLLAPEAAWPLVAGAVLFPSHWHLADKLGLPLAEVHRRVPGYPATQVDRFLDRLRPRQVAWRRNLLFHRDGELHAPRPSVDDVPVAAWWLRSERQTFRRLEPSGAVLFTIHTDTAPLRDLDAGTRRALGERVAAMPEAWAPYAAVDDARADLVTYLRG